ncbi:MAG: FecR domain-containing protein [Tannerella sp.]|jgi:ferric-dicitrate binding protein FerR (iron transport regulator)|nr:FecR domain-containing protein [Tannerella sp.]
MDRELLQQYVEGNVTPEEVQRVTEWLDASEDNVREYVSLHKFYDNSLWNMTGRRPSVLRRKRNIAGRVALECLRVAAVFIIAFPLVRHMDRTSGKTSQAAFHTLVVPAGQRAELTLSDGTGVWLNAQSRLVYPAVFEKGKREVILDGEGYFDVTHDQAQPFTVKTKTLDVLVLGTEFNLIAYDADPHVEVSLLKGNVALKPTGSDRIHRMNPGECVRWNDGVFTASAIDNYEYFKWKDGLLCFDNATVGAILEKLKLYFDVNIDVNKQNLLNYRYTGKFRTKDGVEQVLKVLQLEHKFVYTRDSERNTITIK